MESNRQRSLAEITRSSSIRRGELNLTIVPPSPFSHVPVPVNIRALPNSRLQIQGINNSGQVTIPDRRLAQSQLHLAESLKGKDIPVIAIRGTQQSENGLALSQGSQALLFPTSEAIYTMPGVRIHFANQTRNGDVILSFSYARDVHNTGPITIQFDKEAVAVTEFVKRVNNLSEEDPLRNQEIYWIWKAQQFEKDSYLYKQAMLLAQHFPAEVLNSWGKGEHAKTWEHLMTEIERGESVLELREEGLIRKIDVAFVECTYTDKAGDKFRLVETGHELEGKAPVNRGLAYVSEKAEFVPGTTVKESALTTAARALKTEVNIPLDENEIPLRILPERIHIIRHPAFSYEGLQTETTRRYFSFAALLYELSDMRYEEIVDGTKTTFAWQKISEYREEFLRPEERLEKALGKDTVRPLTQQAHDVTLAIGNSQAGLRMRIFETYVSTNSSLGTIREEREINHGWEFTFSTGATLRFKKRGRRITMTTIFTEPPKRRKKKLEDQATTPGNQPPPEEKTP